VFLVSYETGKSRRINRLFTRFEDIVASIKLTYADVKTTFLRQGQYVTVNLEPKIDVRTDRTLITVLIPHVVDGRAQPGESLVYEYHVSELVVNEAPRKF